MELKLEDFDNQSDHSLKIEEIDEKSAQGLKHRDEEKDVIFLFEDLNEEAGGKLSLEKPNNEPLKKPPPLESHKNKEKDISIGRIDRKPEKENRTEKKKLRRMGSHRRSFFLRFFACCILINLFVWAYFHFSEGMSVIEGLRQLRSKAQAMIQNSFEKIDKPTVALKTVPANGGTEKRERKTQEKTDKLYQQKNQGKVDQATMDEIPKIRKSSPYVMFSWINENGTRVYSNKGFPENEKYADPKIEWR